MSDKLQFVADRQAKAYRTSNRTKLKPTVLHRVTVADSSGHLSAVIFAPYFGISAGIMLNSGTSRMIVRSI